MSSAEQILDRMTQEAGLPTKGAYKPGEVQAILQMSKSTFHRRCEQWEPPGTPGRDPRGLESYSIGTHRRVPRSAMEEWLAANHPLCRTEVTS